ncbi:hypothetical protein [Sphingobium agri]|uniref:Uncharacterized protein n=1 Tax=Sphingobium agri TaxID=2933566 RepID=A0ABT0DWI3_9SPHN|nr:hypothetical protein [Sphingobium agri]MCK0531489.1 hypothetical protein [Sphingobium agri]
MSGEELKPDLRPWGYAPGHYSFRCMDCPEPTSFEGYAQGDKRSIRCEKHALEARDAMFTPEQIAAANAKTDRLTRELDITNADHIALWLEANMADSSLAWLACRIVEAHEAAIRAHPLPEQPREAQIEAAAKAHCDFFGGQGWWDSGLIADTKPKALEAMRVAIAALSPPSTETKESGE